MKSKILISLFLFTTVSCLGQMSRLTFDFSPTSIEKSKVVIEKGKNGYTMTISGKKFKEKCSLNETSMADLNRFLVDYNQKRMTVDSLENVRELEMNQKEEKEAMEQGRTPYNPAAFRMGELIDVGVDLVDKNGSTSIYFTSPQKGTINHTFMVILIKLMNATFQKPKTINYIEKLEGYFYFGIGLKKLSESPLTYKMYGFPWNSEEFGNFMSQLPMDKEIIFDLSNAEILNAKLYKIVKTLCDKNREIKWINCSDEEKKLLIEAGIKASSIF